MPATDTEPTMAELEYNLRSPEAGSLYKHDVGFEELESSDNGQKAMGVRIFRVGDDHYYGPVFFNDGRIRGDELLWSKSDQIFVPFVEEWTRYVLKGRAKNIGDQFDGQIAVSEPDLSPIYEEPPVRPARRSTGTNRTIKPASVRMPDNWPAPVDPREDPEEVIKRGDALLEGVLEEGGENAFSVDLVSVLSGAGNREKLAFAGALEYSPQAAETLLRRVPGLLGALEPKEDADEQAAEAAEKEAAGRKLTAKTVGQVNDGYEQPGSTGIYRLYLKEGGKKRMLVIRAAGHTIPYEAYRQNSDNLLVVDPEDGSAGGANTSQLTADQKFDREKQWTQWWESLDGADVRKNGHYVFVGPEPGEVTNIVEVKEKTTKQNGRVILSVWYTPLEGSSAVGNGSNEPNLSVGDDNVEQVVLTTSEGKKVIEGGKMLIPKTHKAIKIKKMGGSDGPFRHNPLPAFASPDEVLLRHGKPLQLAKMSGRYHVRYDGGDHTALGADLAESLLTDEIGLSEKRASAMMHDFDHYGRDYFLVKQNQVPMGGPQMAPMPGGPAGPPMPMPPGGMPAGPPGMGPAPMGPAPMGPPDEGPPADTLAPEAQETIDAALRAEQEGVEGPIETAMLSNMLTISDDRDFIRQHLGHLLKSVDSLGTILFRLYADWDEFEEDLGSQELTDLVDTVKDVFISEGKLLIRLREKLSGPEDLSIALQ